MILLELIISIGSGQIMSEQASQGVEPASLGELRLPPTFVTDHLIRTLSFQSSMSTMELARHWHVHVDIVVQVVEPLKAAGLLESESSKTNFEALNKVRLSSAGQARVNAARTRTWYAGPLPVSLDEFEQRASEFGFVAPRSALQSAMAPFLFDPEVIDEVGQALSVGAAICLSGLAQDEQQRFAWEVARALPGQVAVPYALYAAGNVIRVLDPRLHRESGRIGLSDDIARERGSRSQWANVARPAVIISGAVLGSDVLPPFDELAKFYLAPAPMAAFGGVLALCDAQQSAREVLREFARLWLSPGRQGAGILLLRSGERIEIPWRATTLIMGETAELVDSFGGAVEYAVDASEIRGRALQAFLTQRLQDADVFPEQIVSRLGEMLGSADLATRSAAAHAARYLCDRRSYEAADFTSSDAVLHAAIQHASVATRRPAARLQQAA